MINKIISAETKAQPKWTWAEETMEWPWDIEERQKLWQNQRGSGTETQGWKWLAQTPACPLPLAQLAHFAEGHHQAGTKAPDWHQPASLRTEKKRETFLLSIRINSQESLGFVPFSTFLSALHVGQSRTRISPNNPLHCQSSNCSWGMHKDLPKHLRAESMEGINFEILNSQPLFL